MRCSSPSMLIDGPEAIKLQEIDKASPGPGQVLVQGTGKFGKSC